MMYKIWRNGEIVLSSELAEDIIPELAKNGGMVKWSGEKVWLDTAHNRQLAQDDNEEAANKLRRGKASVKARRKEDAYKAFRRAGYNV